MNRLKICIEKIALSEIIFGGFEPFVTTVRRQRRLVGALAPAIPS